MPYQPDPAHESDTPPTPPRVRAYPPEALRDPTHTLDARCPLCRHLWTVAHLPMALEKVALLCQRAACPRCAHTSPMIASNGGHE